MGTSVLITCTDGQTVSVGVHKQYDGYDAPKIIAAAQAMTRGQSVSPERAISIIAAAAVTDDFETMGALAAGYNRPHLLVAPLIRTFALETDLEEAILRVFKKGGAKNTDRGPASNLRKVTARYCLYAGLVVVDVRSRSWTWRAFAGSLEMAGVGAVEEA
jgi:hypothetical protein